MVILVRAPSTCHVTLLVLGRYTSIVPPLENNQDNQHESKDIQRLHCHHRQRRALCQVIRVCLVTNNFYA
ncbi:hypothetical protein K402DRAFT_394369 [Aulographum hederae CBS 113979]|uniref:Uncharacterized protein n=1 Tax=Aulographum hederae CBS 113979 TaxID=1176131 RepID=A0A6G1GYF0_9PEZI|nr:hypothetical protein K402DRAFT_398219 [Aulographum hederae CBS 113979]KAF1985758.1 hypothetical protein K402DRAFT_394369 [Aulographum hederae CBS 113979]